MLEPALRRLLQRLPAEAEAWSELADQAARAGLPGEVRSSLRALDRSPALVALAASPGDVRLASLLLDLVDLDRAPRLPGDPAGGEGLPARVERRRDRAPMLRVPGLLGVYLDEFPVTVPRFWDFTEATGTRRTYGWRELKRFRDRPAVYLTLDQARAYAAWVGGRLPGAATYEAAAYGGDGRAYPWGDDPPDSTRACFLPDGVPAPDGYPVVGAYPGGASPSGHQELVGGVYEFLAEPSQEEREDEDPTAPTLGGSWCDGPQYLVRGATTRVLADEPATDVGFRVAVHLSGHADPLL